MNRWTLAMALLGIGMQAHASVVQYDDKAQWQSTVSNDYQTIDFTGLPDATFITNQYANVGATFTDGNDFIWLTGTFLNDGAGLNGNSFTNPDVISISFGAMQHWIGADFPGTLAYKLYQDDVLIYTSSFEHGQGGAGHESFYGLVSDNWFNRAVLFRYTGSGISIDDLYYNAAPAPGALAGLGIGCLLIRTRRRSNR